MLTDDAGDQGRCDIDVLYCVPDKEAFLQRYVDGNRPVLLRGFLHGTPDCTAQQTAKKKKSRKGAAGWPWPALKRWQRAPLLEKHGAATVPARRSSEAANEYGHAHFGSADSGFAANTTTLAAYLDGMRATAVEDSDPMYLFKPVVLPDTRCNDYHHVRVHLAGIHACIIRAPFHIIHNHQPIQVGSGYRSNA